MNLTAVSLRQISMYTINKESSEQIFNVPLDTSRSDDATLVQFTIKVTNSNYSVNDLRELVFVDGSSVKNWIIEILNIHTDATNFKARTHSISEKLFTVTQTNWKKGDLLNGLYETTEHFIFVILKIDENNFIKRGQDGVWVDDVGFNKDIKLQKGLYVTIPKADDAFDLNHVNWKIQSIDKVSGDASYWNKTFLDANFKRDDKTNTIQFRDFFKKYVKTITDPEEQFMINYQFLHYAKNNETFVLDSFVAAIYGDAEENNDKRERLTSEIRQASNANNFDLAFTISKRDIKKDYKPGGFVFDKKIRISYTKSIDSPEFANRFLERQVKLKNEAGEPYTDENGQKYAKVLYDNCEFTE